MSFLLQDSDPEEIQDPNLLLAQQESGYIGPDVEVDQSAIANQMFTNLQARVPGWIPRDGNLDTWMIEAWAEVGSEIRSLAVDVPTSIFATYGSLILNIPPRVARSARGDATFTAVDNQGYTVDAGTTFALARSGNDLVAYQTLQQAVIPVGDTTVGGVPFAAVETGYNGNGLSGEGQMLDALVWVQSITVPSPTVDGQDDERAEDYVNRLANLFPAVGLRPVLPIDFAILTLQLVPGVGRAVAMNKFDPTNGTWNNQRTVTVMVTDPEGKPLSPLLKQEVVTLLESLREVNWVIHAIDPTPATIDVEFDVIAFVGQDNSAVHDACVTAVTGYLNPMTFRLGEMSPAIAGGEVILPPAPGQQPRRQTIWVNELIALLDRALGVDHVVSVTINGQAQNYTLPDPYSLPRAGTVDGTVEGGTAPSFIS